MSPDETYCVLDTNTLLHYQPFDQIDWLAVVGAEGVVLVLCSTVVGELDSRKREPRLRDRARHVLSLLDRYCPDGPSAAIREGVRAEVRPLEPPPDCWTDLDPEVNDDRILAHARALLHEGKTVVVVGADTGLMLKSRALGLDYRCLPDTFRLAEEKTKEQRELEEARLEVQRLESAAPRLVLGFDPDDPADHAVLGPAAAEPMTPEAIEADARREEARLQFRGPVAVGPVLGLGPAGCLGLSGILTAPEVYACNCHLAAYMEEYRAWRWEEAERAEVLGRAVALRLFLVNRGQASASGVRVSLCFEPGTALAAAEDLPPEPERPEPPDPACATYRAVAGIPLPLPGEEGLGEIAIRMPDARPAASGPVVQRDRGEATYEVQSVLQQGSVALPPLYLVFPSRQAVQSFSFGYSIAAQSHPFVARGRLHVRMDAGPPGGGAGDGGEGG